MEIDNPSRGGNGCDRRTTRSRGDIHEFVIYSPTALRRTRGRLRLTQASFARLIGVSADTVRKWEAGTSHPSNLATQSLEAALRAPEILEALARPARNPAAQPLPRLRPGDVERVALRRQQSTTLKVPYPSLPRKQRTTPDT